MTPAVKISETIEQQAWTDIFDAAGPALRGELGLHLQRLGDADSPLLLAAEGIDSLLFNRTIGLCSNDHASFQRAVDRYDQLRIDRYFLHVSGRQRAGFDQLAATRGIERYHRAWLKLVRDPAPPTEATTSLTLAPVSVEQADCFAKLITAGFDMPRSAAPILASLVGRRRWIVFGAFDGRPSSGEPVAAGALFYTGGVGYLAFAATDPAYRRRGAQSALMVARIREALARGCRWVATETGEAVAGEQNHSYRNMIRCGFALVGRRLNYAPVGTRWGRSAPDRNEIGAIGVKSVSGGEHVERGIRRSRGGNQSDSRRADQRC